MCAHMCVRAAAAVVFATAATTQRGTGGARERFVQVVVGDVYSYECAHLGVCVFMCVCVCSALCV